MLIDLLINLPVAFASAYFSWRVLRIPYRYWKVLLFNLLWFLPTQFAAGMVALYPEHILFGIAVVFIQPAAIFLCFFWTGKRGWRDTIVAFLLFFLLIVLGSESGRMLSLIVTALPIFSTITSGPAGGYFATILSVFMQCILLFWGAETICMFLKRHPVDMRWSAFTGVLAAQAVSIFVIVLFVIVFAPAYHAISTFFATFLMAQYIAADIHLLRMFRETVASSELQQKLRLREQQEALQQEQYEQINDQIITLRRMRHDYGNTLDTIRLLIARGNTKEADALALSTGEALRAGIGRYTGHPVLDAVLYQKLRQAERQNIEVALQLAIPERLCIEDRDLLAIFANLADNALEYCASLPDGTKRELVISGAVQGKLLALRFANTYLGSAPPALDDAHTSKPDASHHGLGLAIVRTAAQQYGGELSAAVKGGMLVFTVLLNLSKSETE